VAHDAQYLMFKAVDLIHPQLSHRILRLIEAQEFIRVRFPGVRRSGADGKRRFVLPKSHPFDNGKTA
jgi:hypothetical protein